MTVVYRECEQELVLKFDVTSMCDEDIDYLVSELSDIAIKKYGASFNEGSVISVSDIEMVNH